MARIASADETIKVKWVEVRDAEVTSTRHIQIRHNRHMLRFNAEQLWVHLIRRVWKRPHNSLATDQPAEAEQLASSARVPGIRLVE